MVYHSLLEKEYVAENQIKSLNYFVFPERFFLVRLEKNNFHLISI